MTAIQVRHALDALRVISLTLPDIIALPDPEAAEGLNQRMSLLDMVDQAHEISYSQRLVIIREFEQRSLWRHLIDPLVGEPFVHLTAWLSSGFIGCRRVNFEALRDAKELADVEDHAKLIDVPKSNIRTLIGLSTGTRNLPDVLEAARTLPPYQFEAKIESEHPDQHIEQRKPLRLMPGRSERKVIEEWVTWAQEHDIAGSVTDAIVKACEMALLDAKLDEELKARPADEVSE